MTRYLDGRVVRRHRSRGSEGQVVLTTSCRADASVAKLKREIAAKEGTLGASE